MTLLNSWEAPAIVAGFGLFVFVLGYWVTPWWTDHTARKHPKAGE